MEKPNKTQEILELLKEKELTTSEIQEELGYDLNLIQAIIHRLKNDYKKIKKIGKKGRFTIYKAIEPDLYENTMNNRIIQDKIDKLEKYKIGFNQYNVLFEKIMEISRDKERILTLAKEILDFKLLEQLEMVK